MKDFRAAFAILLVAGLATGLTLRQGNAQSDSAELIKLNRQVMQLYQAGRLGEAIPIAQRALALAEAMYGPDHAAAATALNDLAELYRAQGQHKEAESFFRRSLGIREKVLGADHIGVGISLNNLAELLRQQRRYSDAEPLYKRSAAIIEKALGPDHLNFATVLDNQALLHQAQGRPAEAEALHRRSLAILEKSHGPNHPALLNSLNNLGVVLLAIDRHADAEPFLKRSLATSEKSLGPDHVQTGSAHNSLGGLYSLLGQHQDAEHHFNRALAIQEKSLGPEHSSVGNTLFNLANLHLEQGRHADAEPLYKRSLVIAEKAWGADHAAVATSLNGLVKLYVQRGRYVEAEPLAKRSLEINEKALGPHHPAVADSLTNLAAVFRELRRYSEAEPLYRRSVAIKENTLGRDHSAVGDALNNLAALLEAQKRYPEAEPLYQRSLAIAERVFGPDNRAVGTALNNLAALLAAQSRYIDAIPLYQRSLAIAEMGLGADHPDVSSTLHNLAALHFTQAQWHTAADLWRQSVHSTVRRARLQVGVGKAKGEGKRVENRFHGFIKASYRRTEPATAHSLSELFSMTQWAHSSEAAASLAQMATRRIRGEGTLANLVRERQDLVGEWQLRDNQLIAAISRPTDKRNAANELEAHTRLAAIESRINAIDNALAKDFPEHAALANPEPLSIVEAQTELRSDEALVLFFDTSAWNPAPEETFIWVVTKNKVRWLSIDLGSRALVERVGALRCGLDREAWDGAGCGSLLGAVFTGEDAKAGQPLPFDLARAHELYQALFGQIEDLIKGKHLLIVPSGPLTAFPLQALVTDKPAMAIPADAAGYAAAAWLAKRHAITVLPSVSSLKALRQFAKASKATQPFIGFGNPLLTGPSGTDKRAWEKQSCTMPSAPPQIAARGVRDVISKFFRDGLANVEEVRAQYPLPETADELCAVAQSSGAAEGAVYLGDKASETTIKALSSTGQLAQARIVHFATHGLLAGETEIFATAKAEPSLILTPPQIATEEDDGLLTASEIAQLKLDADWVVLSACNTAAGESDKPGTEALSGLARAFFYAGTRTLLVSHWAVNSDATVKLITKAFDELRTDSNLGRAESLRRSMLALIGTEGNAHPENWAPFVVVGEGSR